MAGKTGAEISRQKEISWKKEIALEKEIAWKVEITWKKETNIRWIIRWIIRETTKSWYLGLAALAILIIKWLVRNQW